MDSYDDHGRRIAANRLPADFGTFEGPTRSGLPPSKAAEPRPRDYRGGKLGGARHGRKSERE